MEFIWCDSTNYGTSLMRADEVATGRGAASARTRRGGTRAMAALAAEPAEAAMDLEEAAAETPSVFGNADRHPYAPVTATVGTAAMCATMRVSRVPRPYCTTTTAPYRSTLTFGKPHPGEVSESVLLASVGVSARGGNAEGRARVGPSAPGVRSRSGGCAHARYGRYTLYHYPNPRPHPLPSNSQFLLSIIIYDTPLL
jgi:hypothetical protein